MADRLRTGGPSFSFQRGPKRPVFWAPKDSQQKTRNSVTPKRPCLLGLEYLLKTLKTRTHDFRVAILQAAFFGQGQAIPTSRQLARKKNSQPLRLPAVLIASHGPSLQALSRRCASKICPAVTGFFPRERCFWVPQLGGNQKPRKQIRPLKDLCLKRDMQNAG